MQEALIQPQLIQFTIIKNIKFSRCKCLGGMFGPIKMHNKLFYCQYNPEQLKSFIAIQTLIKLFQPLYSQPVLKIQRLFTFLLYALSIYLLFYTIFAIILLSFGEISWDWFQCKFQIQGVLCFLGLMTFGIANQFIFLHEKRLIEEYINTLNRIVFRQHNVYMKLLEEEKGYYLCKYSFRLLSTIQIRRIN